MAKRKGKVHVVGRAYLAADVTMCGLLDNWRGDVDVRSSFDGVPVADRCKNCLRARRRQ